MKAKNFFNKFIACLIFGSICTQVSYSLPPCFGKDARRVACQSGRFSFTDVMDPPYKCNMYIPILDSPNCYERRLATVGLSVVINESGISSATLLPNPDGSWPHNWPLSTLTGWQLSNNVSNSVATLESYSFQFNATTFFGNMGWVTTDQNSIYFSMNPSDMAERALVNWGYDTAYIHNFTNGLGGPQFSADTRLLISKVDGTKETCKLGLAYGFFDQSSQRDSIIARFGTGIWNSIIIAMEDRIGLPIPGSRLPGFDVQPWELVWYIFRHSDDPHPTDGSANGTATGGEGTDGLSIDEYFPQLKSVIGPRSEPIVIYCADTDTGAKLAYKLTPDPDQYLITLTRYPSQDIR
jgi:hypothetical protein